MRESFVAYAAGEPGIHNTPEDRCKPSWIAGQTWLAGRPQGNATPLGPSDPSEALVGLPADS